MLYLVRHGETVWNAAGRYQGAKDSRLTPKGRAQASATGRLVRSLVAEDIPLPAAVSPLGRAQETATLIAQEVPILVCTEPRISEVSIGSWDGLTDFEIEAEYPGSLSGATPYDWFFRSPDGEPLDAVVARVSAWLAGANGPLLIISHGLTGRIIRGLYLGLSAREMLALPVPHDGVFVLAQGAVEFLAAPSR